MKQVLEDWGLGLYTGQLPETGSQLSISLYPGALGLAWPLHPQTLAGA